MQDFDEARHVRALEIVRQVHIHIEISDGVLLAAHAVFHLDWMKDVLDADFVDGYPTRIGAALYVFDGRHGGFLGGNDVHFS